MDDFIKWGTLIIALMAFLWGVHTFYKQNKFNNDLENLKSQLNQKEVLLESTIKFMSNHQQELQKQKVEGVKELWESVLYIDDTFNDIRGFYSILLPKEYNERYQKWIGSKP